MGSCFQYGSVVVVETVVVVAVVDENVVGTLVVVVKLNCHLSTGRPPHGHYYAPAVPTCSTVSLQLL